MAKMQQMAGCYERRRMAGMAFTHQYTAFTDVIQGLHRDKLLRAFTIQCPQRVEAL